MKQNKKKLSARILALAVAAVFCIGLVACAKTPEGSTPAPAAPNTPAASDTPEPVKTDEQSPTSSFDTSKAISVISREDGSGTRGAFIELMGILNENKEDMTTVEAAITNDTSVMLTTVAGNPYAIGYVSLGSLNSSVKALAVDGAEATVANINAGTYKVSRPFQIVTKGEASGLAADFIGFILSAEGQAVVEGAGYIAVGDAPAYAGSAESGKLVIAGSSSVTPVMEKLKEAYIAINSGVTIDIQQSDSSTGMKSAIEGICDIGMASRDLKDSETAEGLVPIVIAMDGIAVIVNNGNTVSALTTDQIRAIFTGETTVWNEVA